MIRRSSILDTTVRLTFDGALVVSVYLLFAGHNQPGGGFVGGLVAAGALALRFVAGGVDDVRAVVRIRPWSFLSVGLGVVVLSAMAPMISGRDPLDQSSVQWTWELFGTAKATSATVFDTGVYLIVVGLVLMIIEGIGDDTGAPSAEGAEGDDGPVDADEGVAS